MDVKPPLPASLKGYALREVLGEGSMGVVYRAVVQKARRGLAAGQEVALKVLGESLDLDPQVVRRFKREAGVGLRSRHPGLARVHEIGSVRLGSRRVHFIAQELLRGRNLRELLEEMGAMDEALVRRIGAQVARALNFVHSRGIVHRDLKPANLFLDQQGGVKVVDFGLARVMNQGADLGAPGRPSARGGVRSSVAFRGTLAYAAPEQIMGRPATPASDLYSLGVVLHELAAGRHPYEAALEQGGDALLLAIQTEQAPGLTRVRSSASFLLETLLRRLLERAPADRGMTAREVATVLEDGERSDWWKEATSEETRWISPFRRGIVVRRRTRMVGRAPLQERLDRTVQDLLRKGRGTALWVEGEVGLGKTRLLDDLVLRLEESGAEIYGFAAHCAPTAAPLPLQPLRATLLAALGLEGWAPEDAAPRARERLREYLKGGAARLDEMVEHLVGDRDANTVSEESVAERYVEVFQALARERPTVLLVEGLHNAGTDTLRVLGELASARAPLALVMTSRLEQPRGEAAALHWRVREAAEVLRLESLGPADIQDMLRDLALILTRPERVSQRLWELSGGNPWFTLELVDLLVQRHQLDRLSRRGVIGTSVPRSLVELFAHKWEEVPAEAHPAVEVAAVLGGTVRFHVLRSVSGLEEVPFSALLGELEARAVLVLLPGQKVRFRHGSFRQFVRDRIPDSRRREVHRQVARFYDSEAERPGASLRTPWKAALHADLGRDRPLLSRHLTQAVLLLRNEGRHEDSLRLLRSAVDQAREAPEDADLRLRSLLLLADVTHRLGQRQDEEQALTEAVRLAVEREDAEARSRGLHGLGRLRLRTGHFVAAESHLRAALDGVDPSGSHQSRSLILLDLAECLQWSGDEERAIRVLAQAEESLDQDSPPLVRGRYWKERANLLLELERFDEARAAFRQARALLRGLDLRALERAVVLGTARLQRELADYEGAARAARVVVNSAEADGDLRHEAIARFVQGEAEARRGNPGMAHPLILQALRLAHRAKDDTLAVHALSSLALLYRWKRFHRYSLRKALRYARRAVARAHQLAVGRLEARAQAALALCYRDQNRRRWALAITRKALREAGSAGVARKRVAEIHWIHGLMLMERGRTARGRTHRARAQELLVQRLEGIGSERIRERIWAHDPLYREIGRPST